MPHLQRLSNRLSGMEPTSRFNSATHSNGMHLNEHLSGSNHWGSRSGQLEQIHMDALLQVCCRLAEGQRNGSGG